MALRYRYADHAIGSACVVKQRDFIFVFDIDRRWGFPTYRLGINCNRLREKLVNNRKARKRIIRQNFRM